MLHPNEAKIVKNRVSLVHLSSVVLYRSVWCNLVPTNELSPDRKVTNQHETNRGPTFVNNLLQIGKQLVQLLFPIDEIHIHASTDTKATHCVQRGGCFHHIRNVGDKEIC